MPMNGMSVNGITLNVALDGDVGGDAVVFINSLGTDLRIWNGILPHLLENLPRIRVIRYDKRGHGLSDCPPAPYSISDHAGDLSGLLDMLDVDAVTLVGISVGGMIALQFAARYPQRVRGLALLDTAAKIGSADMWNERIDTLRAGGMSALAGPILERWFAAGFARRDPAAYRLGYNMLTRTPVAGYTGTCEAIRDADLTGALPGIQAPTLVLCGAEDSATPPELVGGLAGALPNAQFALLEGAGHLSCWEKPQETAVAIGAFLNTLFEHKATPKSRYETGMSIRRSVLGDAHVDRAQANKTGVDADFQRLITEFAWGTAWAGSELDRQTRHLITIAIIAALGKEHELALHLRATRNTGVTAQQLKGAFHQVAVYAGVPAANTAFGIAKRVLSEDTEDGQTQDP